MNSTAEKYIRKEALPFIFCPGCGHGIVVNSFLRVIDKLGIGKNQMGLVSGIGCSSWSPVYLQFDCTRSTAVLWLRPRVSRPSIQTKPWSSLPVTEIAPVSAATISSTPPREMWT